MRSRDPDAIASTEPYCLAPATGATLPMVIAVVLNWNLPAETRWCIRHILESTYPNLGVIVVDNGSNDSSPRLIGAEYPLLDLIILPENQGYAGGNNAGIARALDHGADFVLLVNNDAVLAPDTIANLIGGIGHTSGMATPRINYAASDRLWHAGARLGRLNPLPRAVTETDLADGNPCRVDFVVGCVLLIRRVVFEKIGLLDERYFVYYEDLDFSTRAREAGFEIVSVPAARAWHEIGASTRRDTPRRTYLLERYRTVWCLQQDRGLAGIAWWLTLVLALARIGTAALRSGSSSHLLAALRGVRDGLLSRDSRRPRIPRI